MPAITVIVDGGWSKRSHRHSYNANSGVAIIIGKETGKLLFIGVRNKYCTACARNTPHDKHTCYKNWNKSSSEMETDILLEGLLNKYMVFVTHSLLATETALFTPHYSRMFPVGGMPSKSWNVPTMLVNATGDHLKNLFKTTLLIKAVGDSPSL